MIHHPHPTTGELVLVPVAAVYHQARMAAAMLNLVGQPVAEDYLASLLEQMEAFWLAYLSPEQIAALEQVYVGTSVC